MENDIEVAFTHLKEEVMGITRTAFWAGFVCGTLVGGTVIALAVALALT